MGPSVVPAGDDVSRAGSTKSSLRFAHLSDIHFRIQVGGDLWDENVDLRRELENDLRRVVGESGPLDGILVTGDIAFSGETDEFEAASEWLTLVAEIAQCAESEIWTVPGNHDVHRPDVAASPTIQDFHGRLRSIPRPDIDAELARYLVADKAGGEAFLAPLRKYVSFATRYGCPVTPTKPYWEHTLPIRETGYFVRLRGMTTPLISDEHDDLDGGLLVLGSVQARMERRANTITFTLAHHPPAWLRDAEAVTELLRTRAQVQLWGHGHVQRLSHVDNSVHLYAGAVHPYRTELTWEPRYNVIEVCPVVASAQCRLTIQERIWRRQEARFGPDLGFSGNPATTVTLGLESMANLGYEEQGSILEPAAPEPARGAKRALAYAFSSLPYQRRLAVSRNLGLLDEASRDLTDQDLFEIVLASAVRNGILSELWDGVQKARERPMGENPFRHTDDASIGTLE